MTRHKGVIRLIEVLENNPDIIGGDELLKEAHAYMADENRKSKFYFNDKHMPTLLMLGKSRLNCPEKLLRVYYVLKKIYMIFWSVKQEHPLQQI